MKPIDFYIADEVNDLGDLCHKDAKKAGWWPKKVKNNPMCFSHKLMLIVSELSEALEGDRKDLMDDHLTSRTMREVELADALIRIFDLAAAFELDIGGALVEKLEYNRTREDHKPKARSSKNGKKY